MWVLTIIKQIYRVDAKEEVAVICCKAVIDLHWHGLLNGKLKLVILLSRHLKLVFKTSMLVCEYIFEF